MFVYELYVHLLTSYPQLTASVHMTMPSVGPLLTKVSSHTTDTDFCKITLRIPSEPPLPKLNSVRSRVAYLSGIKPDSMTVVRTRAAVILGAHETLCECPYCNEP